MYFSILTKGKKLYNSGKVSGKQYLLIAIVIKKMWNSFGKKFGKKMFLILDVCFEEIIKYRCLLLNRVCIDTKIKTWFWFKKN